MQSSFSVQEPIEGGRFTPVQFLTIALCVFLNTLDGFDLLALAFAAPGIAKDWNVGPVQLGLLFSTSVATLTVGSILIVPFGDIVGRRPVILLSLALATAGTALAGAANNLLTLGIARAILGLGVGVMVPSINTMVAEYSPRKWSSVTIAIMSVGFPVGALIGGLLSVALTLWWGWHAIFEVGAVLMGVSFVIALLWLPESLNFLLTHSTPRRHIRAASLARKLKISPDALAATERAPKRLSILVVLRKPYLAATVLVSVAYLLLAISNYFILNWIPKLLVDAGHSVGSGISGSAIMNLGGLFGGVAIGFIAMRIGIARAGAIFMLVTFLATVFLGLGAHGEMLPIVMCFIVGVFIQGAVTSNYIILPHLYPTEIRASGSGLVFGVARIGGIIGPLLGGAVLSAGASISTSLALMALPAAIGGFLVLSLHRYERR